MLDFIVKAGVFKTEELAKSVSASKNSTQMRVSPKAWHAQHGICEEQEPDVGSHKVTSKGRF